MDNCRHWQMTPAELQKTNWPRAVGGVICCCHHATCTVSNSSRHIDYLMTSSDLAQRTESVELLHGPLRPHLPLCLQLSGTSRPQLVRTIASCPRTASSGQRVLLPLPIGLLYGCAFMRRERTRMCPRVWSSWLALAEGEARDLCDVHGQQRAAFVGRGQELRLKRKHSKQNRSVSSTRLSSQAYAWRLARLVQRSPLSPRLVDQNVGLRQILLGTPTSSGYRQDQKGPSQSSQSPEPWTGPVGSSCCPVVV